MLTGIVFVRSDNDMPHFSYHWLWHFVKKWKKKKKTHTHTHKHTHTMNVIRRITSKKSDSDTHTHARTRAQKQQQKKTKKTQKKTKTTRTKTLLSYFGNIHKNDMKCCPSHLDEWIHFRGDNYVIFVLPPFWKGVYSKRKKKKKMHRKPNRKPQKILFLVKMAETRKISQVYTFLYPS